jgi:hypothetical protein
VNSFNRYTFTANMLGLRRLGLFPLYTPETLDPPAHLWSKSGGPSRKSSPKWSDRWPEAQARFVSVAWAFDDATVMSRDGRL